MVLNHLENSTVVEFIVKPGVSIPTDCGQEGQEEGKEAFGHLGCTKNFCHKPPWFPAFLNLLALGACSGEMVGCLKCRLLYSHTHISQPLPAFQDQSHPRLKLNIKSDKYKNLTVRWTDIIDFHVRPTLWLDPGLTRVAWSMAKEKRLFLLEYCEFVNFFLSQDNLACYDHDRM